jgi:hypothetical protein
MKDPAADPPTYREKVVTVEEAAHAALAAQLNSASALTWTDALGHSHSISCWYGMEGGELRFSGPMLNRAYEFTLVSETPTIS